MIFHAVDIAELSIDNMLMFDAIYVWTQSHGYQSTICTNKFKLLTYVHVSCSKFARGFSLSRNSINHSTHVHTTPHTTLEQHLV